MSICFRYVVVWIFCCHISGQVCSFLMRAIRISHFTSSHKQIRPLTMAFFGGGDDKEKLVSDVVIESPSMNSRQITASVVIDSPIENIWSILTDYDRLTDHVPNLVKSYRVPSSKDTTRIFQEGAQRIIGFEFRASLMMDMYESSDYKVRSIYNKGSKDKTQRELYFKLVESTMFSSFDGTWTIKSQALYRDIDPTTKLEITRYRTQLTYSVYVKPKGPVPIIALEWRIREDIPVNLLAVKEASEKLGRIVQRIEKRLDKKTASVDWGMDETLGQYILKDD